MQVCDAIAGRIAPLVRYGVVELGIVPGEDPEPDLSMKALFEDSLVAVMQAVHTLTTQRMVMLEALFAEPLVLPHPDSSVRTLFDRACAAQGRAVNAA